jgi:hypothetical protein
MHDTEYSDRKLDLNGIYVWSVLEENQHCWTVAEMPFRAREGPLKVGEQKVANLAIVSIAWVRAWGLGHPRKQPKRSRLLGTPQFLPLLLLEDTIAVLP